MSRDTRDALRFDVGFNDIRSSVQDSLPFNGICTIVPLLNFDVEKRGTGNLLAFSAINCCNDTPSFCAILVGFSFS